MYFYGGVMKNNIIPKIWFLFFILICLTIFGCSDNTPIKIGFVAGITGRVSELGISERAGAMLAVSEINASGGINGRPVELIIKDDQNDTKTALKVDQELIEKGVVAIIGHATSTMTKAAVPLINKSKILMISPTSSTTDLSGKDDFLVRITPLSDAEMRTLAELAIKLQVEKIAVVFDLSNKSLVENNLKIFRKYYEKHQKKIIASASFESGSSTSFFSIANKLIEGNPDGIFILAGSIDAASLCQQIRKVDKKLPIFTVGWATTDDLIKHGGNSVEGINYVQAIDMNSSQPMFKKFSTDLKTKFSLAPNFGSIYAYQAVYMLYEAIKNSSNFDSKALKDFIVKRKTFQGVQGDYNIDEFGDSKGTFKPFTIRNGKFVSE
jgi:branched-chain amino acid transport system substrate-binding protein